MSYDHFCNYSVLICRNIVTFFSTLLPTLPGGPPVMARWERWVWLSGCLWADCSLVALVLANSGPKRNPFQAPLPDTNPPASKQKEVGSATYRAPPLPVFREDLCWLKLRVSLSAFPFPPTKCMEPSTSFLSIVLLSPPTEDERNRGLHYCMKHTGNILLMSRWRKW